METILILEFLNTGMNKIYKMLNFKHYPKKTNTVMLNTYFISLSIFLFLPQCKKNEKISNPSPVAVSDSLDLVKADTVDYTGIPQSAIYEVTVIHGEKREKQLVFQNACPDFQPGYMNMMDKDKFPLEIFKNRSISWTNFSFSGIVTIEVKLLDQAKVPMTGPVKIIPSRYGIKPTVEGNVIRFVLTKPGQCSVEIGENGYKNGLMIFANPAETNIPDPDAENFAVLKHASQQDVNDIATRYSGIYFKKGVHDIGVYKIPAHIKSIYFEEGSWVYGSLKMDGRPNVKIYGRGVLSSAKLNYRESHCIEAINQSDNITLEGIVIADPKYFAVRLIGKNNKVDWLKIIGGWVYNCDGISAFEGSTVSNCFIWANDDNIKVYRNNIQFTDIVCWQLNNGGVIQLSWGNGNASNVDIRRVDILHAEWNRDESNRGVISCVGDKFAEGGMNGLQQNFLIEDLVTETPVSLVFRISPNAASPNMINGMVFKNWNVKMDMSIGYNNYLVGADADNKYKGIVFDNFIFNDTKLLSSNWINVGRFHVENIESPVFK